MNVLIDDKKTKFLQFVKMMDTNGVYFEVEVLNKDSFNLGLIHYYKPWGKYVFDTYYEELIFDENCLMEIANYLRELNGNAN